MTIVFLQGYVFSTLNYSYSNFARVCSKLSLLMNRTLKLKMKFTTKQIGVQSRINRFKETCPDKTESQLFILYKRIRTLITRRSNGTKNGYYGRRKTMKSPRFLKTIAAIGRKVKEKSGLGRIILRIRFRAKPRRRLIRRGIFGKSKHYRIFIHSSSPPIGMNRFLAPISFLYSKQQ